MIELRRLYAGANKSEPWHNTVRAQSNAEQNKVARPFEVALDSRGARPLCVVAGPASGCSKPGACRPHNELKKTPAIQVRSTSDSDFDSDSDSDSGSDSDFGSGSDSGSRPSSGFGSGSGSDSGSAAVAASATTTLSEWVRELRQTELRLSCAELAES